MDFIKIDKTDNSIVKTDSLIKNAIASIEESKIKIAFVADENNKIIATVTDGDIRRGLLKGFTLEDTVEKFMRSSFKSVSVGAGKSLARQIMQKAQVKQIPEIDSEGCITGVHLIDGFLLPNNNLPNSVLLMAGGRGERLRPLTDSCPKPMLEVGGQPILEIILEKFIKAGIRSFYVSVGYLKEQIIDYFGDGSNWDVEIKYLEEDYPLGTGGAVKLIKEKIRDPLIVMNGDIITSFNLERLLDFHKRKQSSATLCVRESHLISPYGVVETSGEKLVDIKEKPVITQLVNAGIYILNQSIIDLIQNDKAIDMPDLFIEALNKEYSIFTFPIYEYWLDIGHLQTLEQAKRDLN